MKSKIKAAVVCIVAVLAVVVLLGCLALRCGDYPRLLRRNFDTFSTVAVFLNDLDYERLVIHSSDSPYNFVSVFDAPDQEGRVYRFYYEDEEITKQLERCFYAGRCQVISKEEGCIVFQIDSTLDQGWGLLYTSQPLQSDTFMIGACHFEVYKLEEEGWYSYTDNGIGQ